MPRKRLPHPVAYDEIVRDPNGPPLRLRDMAHISGFSRSTLFADIQCGTLAAWKRRYAGNGSPFFIDRSEALAYLARVRQSAA